MGVAGVGVRRERNKEGKIVGGMIEKIVGGMIHTRNKDDRKECRREMR